MPKAVKSVIQRLIRLNVFHTKTNSDNEVAWLWYREWENGRGVVVAGQRRYYEGITRKKKGDGCARKNRGVWWCTTDGKVMTWGLAAKYRSLPTGFPTGGLEDRFPLDANGLDWMR